MCIGWLEMGAKIGKFLRRKMNERMKCFCLLRTFTLYLEYYIIYWPLASSSTSVMYYVLKKDTFMQQLHLLHTYHFYDGFLLFGKRINAILKLDDICI